MLDPAAISSMVSASPSVSLDLVHVELSLQELLDVFRQGVAVFQHGADLLRQVYCSLPFVRSC